MASLPHRLMRLNDGRLMPALGLGTWQMNDPAAAAAVRSALQLGYRLVDTAAIYGNEAGVGQGLRAAGIPREQVFVTTKIWNDRHLATADSLRTSLARLELEYVDLLLVHWPVPSQNRFRDAWRGLIELRDRGLTRSIGVSNFNVDHLEAIIADTGVVPALNQIELHPGFPQSALREFHGRHGIVTQAWSPLGRGQSLQDPTILAIAHKLRRTPAQIILCSQLQAGLSTVPKSTAESRLRENLAALDFRLVEEDLAALWALDGGKRLGPDPRVFG